MKDYKQIAKESRLKVLDLIYKAQTSHIGSNFSVADIMAVLFENVDLEKDKVILSKGWAAAMLYYHLWRKGRITDDELNSYCKKGSKFIGLAEPIIPEISFAGGSMGYGLPAGVGFALAKKMKDENGRVFVIVSDGELNCGTTWESILIASKYKLDNLTVIIDMNGYQAMGTTEDILPVDHYHLFASWDGVALNGHDYRSLEVAITSKLHDNKPFVIFAKTVKGRGVSFMENKNLWHYMHVDDEHYEKALEELR